MVLIAKMSSISDAQISCEREENRFWGDSVGTANTCFLHQTTSINSDEFSFVPSKDESIGGLYFAFNKNIRFLPIRTVETFSNLLACDARYCSLTSVTLANFKGLNKLISLYLSGNQIATINSETFQDMSALEELHLCKNFENHFPTFYKF